MKKTNKTFKRFAAITSASLLAACAVAPAVMNSFAADETYSITINNSVAGHTYEAYQIFSGDLSADETTLSNVDWGNGVTAEALSKITALDLYKSCTDAASVAKILSDNNSEANAIAFANAISTALGTATASTNVHVDTDSDGTADSYVITDTDLTAGYYLIKDANDTQNKENGAYTSFILKVIKDETTGVKTGLPTVVKKVQENSNVSDYTENGETRDDYNDVADYSIGDDIPFALYGTMPENISSYSSYKYIFNDTLSAGLAYNDDVKVYVGEDLVDSSCYNATHTNGELKISFNDVKSLKKNGTEEIIAISDSSIIRVDYTAKLDEDANIGWDGNPNEVYLQYSNNPNAGGEGDLGSTKKDYVIVYTYGIDIDKVNQSKQTEKLEGAEFLLYNADKTKSAVVKDGKFSEWVDGNSGTTLTSDENGNIKVAGLDKGVYYMCETKAPDQFNLPEGDAAYFKVEIIAETENGQNWDGISCALNSLTDDTEVKNAETGDVEKAKDGLVESIITNTKGATLPGTGGIGTTIFYLGGGAMAAIGGVYLISKRRMKKSEE